MPSLIDDAGWLLNARRIESPNFDERPNEVDRRGVTLLVIHYISLPPERFVGDAIERLFTNRLESDDPDPELAAIADLKVSSHFVIRRHGLLQQFVSCDKRAWHAGLSNFQGRDRCNDFSIGIELEGSSKRPFTESQYQRLIELVGQLRFSYGLIAVAGHSDIAPNRKQDPGPLFDWHRMLKTCGLPRPQVG